MSIVGANGMRLRGQFSSYRFTALLQCSTLAAKATQSQDQTHIMVDYLMNSLGFPREEAITTSTKLRRLKSTENLNLVINFFKQNGLENAQIRRIVSTAHRSLSCRVERTLKPKFKFLQDLGMSGSDLAKFLSGHSTFFDRRLDTVIIPRINYLKEVLGSEEDVVKAITKSKWLLSSGTCTPQRMQQNVSLLKGSGFSNDFIKRLLCWNPRIVLQKPEWIEEVFRRAEMELGIPLGSPMFYYGLRTVCSCSKSNLEIKFGVFRSFGWTDSDINTLVRGLPQLLSSSESKIQARLNFFMRVLEFSTEYLVHHPVLFTLSLERRVMPRNEVLKILEDKKLLRGKVDLYSVVRRSEANFIMNFLLPYKDELPDIYESYMKRREQ